MNSPRGARSGMLAAKHGVRHDQVLPVVRIAEVTPTGVTKYRPETEVQTAAQVVSFVEAWSRQELKPYYKSLPPPDPLPKGRLYEVVADTWGDFMKEENDYVFSNAELERILFYSNFFPNFLSSSNVFSNIWKSIF